MHATTGAIDLAKDVFELIFADSLGRIRKRKCVDRVAKHRGVYLRTLLINGARALLLTARRAEAKGKTLDRLRSGPADLAERVGQNKAAVAVAKKLARRLWATEHHRTDFNPDHESFPNSPVSL